MKRLVLSASALALLSGIALAAPAQAGSYNRHGNLTSSERATIARSAAHLNAVKRHARADGQVSGWERAKIRMAETRYNALVWRLRHN
jgi:hypothetical protein